MQFFCICLTLLIFKFCSDNSPDSPKLSRRRGNSRGNSPSSSPAASPAASPSRPSTLSVGTGSQPIPVPTQVKAFQQMQQSSGSPRSASPGHRMNKAATTPGSLEALSSSGKSQQNGVPIPGRKASTCSIPEVGSMSPPAGQYHYMP